MKLLDYLVLPEEITPFERSYLARVNRIAVWFFALHVPFFSAIAFVNDTKPLLAAALTSFLAVGPFFAERTWKNPRHVSMIIGFTSMAMGALLVNFGRGPMTIEMHFYFFVLLALLSVFANPLPILVAALTVALHHAIFWALLPSAVFNYDAPFSAVFVHALFVVLESIAACFVARSFFDNVIGLDRIVLSRTAELDAKNREMTQILDNVGQGFVRLDASGRFPRAFSLVLREWLGEPRDSETFFSWLERSNGATARWLEVGWDSLFEGFLPLSVAVEQLPRNVSINSREFSLEYRPIQSGENVESVLVVMSDVTAELAQERAEQDQQELLSMVERLLNDRSGLVAFLDEVERLVRLVEGQAATEDKVRAIHTLKGNFGLFGLASLAHLCHDIETQILEEGARTEDVIQPLLLGWMKLVKRLSGLLGETGEEVVEIKRGDYDRLRNLVRTGDLETGTLLAQLELFLKEPADKRLSLLANQAKVLANRFEKQDLEVFVEGGEVRLPGRSWGALWASLVHLVRNAVDHGIETRSERQATGKAEPPRLELAVRAERGIIEVSISDNGRGIDFEKVRRLAAERGLPTDSQEELTRALFADGLSTKSEVTDISGRGIGMSAVLRECEALGGRIEVSSTKEQGTTFCLRIPDRVSLLPAAAE